MREKYLLIIIENKMKKLSLKNLKVVKISDQEKATISGGSGGTWPTTSACGCGSGPYISWCNGCPG